MSHGRIYFLEEHRSAHLESWVDRLSIPATFVPLRDTLWTPPEDAALVVTPNQYEYPYVSTLRQLVETDRCGVLIMADGILEYRNTFLNPGTGAGALFQPVLGHKIACIGRSQARTLEQWGNKGRCEVVGIPRLDELSEAGGSHSEGDFRILVSSARRVSFTDDQWKVSLRSFSDLRQWFRKHRVIGGRRLCIRWRLASELADEIGIPLHERDCEGVRFAESILNVDALITAPSTAALEGMKRGIPVMLVDYHLVPKYLSSAWEVSAAEHLDPLIPELINPPKAKMLYQSLVLSDSLECQSDATPRILSLIEQMFHHTLQCRRAGSRLAFPEQILPGCSIATSQPLELSEYYTGRPALADQNRIRTLVEFDHLHTEIAKSRQQIRRLNKHLARYRSLLVSCSKVFKSMKRLRQTGRDFLRLLRRR